MLRCIRTNGNCPGKLNFPQHWVLITISGLLRSFMSFFVLFSFCLLFSGFLQDLRPYMSVNDDRFQVSSSKPKDYQLNGRVSSRLWDKEEREFSCYKLCFVLKIP